MLDLHGTVTEMKKVLEVLVSGTKKTNSTLTVMTSTLSSTSVTSSTTVVTSTSPLSSTPVASTSVNAVTYSTPIQASTSTVVPTEPACEVEISHSNLIPDAEIMQMAMKSCSRMNFAAKLSVRLFDEETRLTHNVAGRGKPQLDTKIMAYIIAKCFEVFPCNTTEKMSFEWAKCITAIDECSRRLKNKGGKKKLPVAT